MELKEEFKDFLQQSYAAINDLNRSADLAPKQKLLQQSKRQCVDKVEKLLQTLHKCVDDCGTKLYHQINIIIKQKSETLVDHSNEIVQCMDYMSNLCMMAEKLVKERNLQVVTSFGPQLKTEFQKSLKECRDMKLVDYDTFVSLDVDIDLRDLAYIPFVQLVSRSQHYQKSFEVLHTASLGASAFESGVIMNDQQIDDKDRKGRDPRKVVSKGLAHPLPPPHEHQLRHADSNSSSLISLLRCKQNLESINEIPNLERIHVKEEHDNEKTVKPSVSHMGKSADLLSVRSQPSEMEPKNKTPSSTFQCSSGVGTLTDLVQRCEAFELRSKTQQSLSEVKLTSSDDAFKSSHLDHVRPCYMDQPEQVVVKTASKKKQGRIDAIANWNDMKILKNNPDIKQVTSAAENEVENEPDSLVTQKSERELKSYSVPRNLATEVTVSDRNGHNCESQNSQRNTESGKLKAVVCQGNSMTRTVNTLSQNVLESSCVQCSSEKPVSDAVSQMAKLSSSAKSHDQSEPIYNPKPWNLDCIKPVKMTFDLRTVMPTIRHGIPEIHGELVKTITGGIGTAFDHPTGITVAADGRIIVADTGKNVVRILQDNVLVHSLGHNDGIRFVRPSAVVSDTMGNIYVKDDLCIQVFDGKGKKLVKTIGSKLFHSPYGLALIKSGEEPCVVVIDAGRTNSVVFHYLIKKDELCSFSYDPLLEFGTSTSKVRFFAAHDGLMLTSDLGASTMYLSSLTGKTLKCFGIFGSGLAEFREPSGVTVDAAGNWIVGDSKNNRIQVFTNDGHFLALLRLSSPIRRPSGIHLTSDGHLYIINYLDSIIKVYRLHR